LPQPTRLCEGYSETPYVFVVDDAFPLTSEFMKPFPRELCKGSSKRIFHYRLSRARRIVENALGILASVFRLFPKPLAAECNTAENVLACIYEYLHNFLRRNFV
jgi:hypothetical protein